MKHEREESEERLVGHGSMKWSGQKLCLPRACESVCDDCRPQRTRWSIWTIIKCGNRDSRYLVILYMDGQGAQAWLPQAQGLKEWRIFRIIWRMKSF